MKSLRFLMGIGILTVLTPAMAVVFPNQFAAINPFDSGDSVRSGATALAATDEFTAPGEGSGSETELTEHPINTSLNTRPDEQAAIVGNPESSDIEHSHEPQTTEPDPDAGKTTDESSNSADSSKATSPSTSKATTTSDASSDDDSTETVKTDGTITGDACPCKVTGTVELKGEVNLKGDLMVDGGTLVARSGVTVNGNRFQIMFLNGGKADFHGTKTSTWSGNGSNANLKRDVEFRNLRRIMFHQGAGVSTLKYVSVIDSGATGVLGDYPLHWHLNGNSTRGTLVEGVVVLNGRNHAYVPHGSHGITLRDVIAKNTTEEAIWWDTPSMPPCQKSDRNCTLNDSHDIKITRALVDGVDTSRKYKYEITGMLLSQGNGNSVVSSVVRNVASGTSCSAYHWPEGAHGKWSFVGNSAYAGPCSTAIFVWENNNDGGPNSVIEGFTTNGIVDHGAYRNAYEYNNVTAPTLNSHAVGYTIRNSTFDTIDLRKHPVTGEVRFINVNASRVTLYDGSGKAGNYIFEGTSLTCADVDFVDPHPSSKVVINGEEC
jgi:hypothetical protein